MRPKKYLDGDFVVYDPSIKTADLTDELTPGPLKDELLNDFDPSQETYEEYLQRKNLDRPFNAAQGGRANLAIGGGVFHGEELPNNREGFSEVYGPNIRKRKDRNTFEVTLKRGGQTYYENFTYGDGTGTGPKPKYATEEEALKAANKFRDSVKNLPKETGKYAKGRPVGFKPETGQSAEIRRILNQFISEGKTSFSNKDVKELIDEDKLDLFETDRTLITAIDRVKREPEFKDLNFVDARSLKEKGEYFTDSNVRKIIKENYGKVKQETLAKLTFPDEPLTTSKSRLELILSDMADKGEIKRLKRGEASEERLGEFDPSPESQKKSKIAKRRRKKIDILGSTEYEDELYEFKKQVQESLGLEKVKGGKYDPIDMGHQSSITQLKALKQQLRPEDLNPQFYKVNQLGIKKFEGGVKTLEKALDTNFYPVQKRLYNKAKKFINEGKAIPKELQNKIIASNERIQQFIDKTVEKYPLLKDRVNAVTVDPNDITVRRGDNVIKQLGIGLVDQNLGDIEIGSIDDLTIKANLAEQTLQEAINADLIDEKIGRQKLDTFLKAQPLELEEVSNVQKVFRKMGTQLNSGMDPKLLIEYLGAEIKDIAAFGKKYGGNALGKVGKGITGIDLPIIQVLFASTYDIEKDSPLWLTLPAAFTDEVANIFNLYKKSPGKIKNFGKFLASSFVPQALRSPIFKAATKIGRIGSLAAPLTEAAVQAYRFEKMKQRRDEAIRNFGIPEDIANKAFDDYIRSTIPETLAGQGLDYLEVPESPGLEGIKRGAQQFANLIGLAEDPYAQDYEAPNPMQLERLYQRQGFKKVVQECLEEVF